MVDNRPYPSSIVNGTTAVRTYKRGGLELSAAPLDEYVSIRTGAINRNSKKNLPLSEYINYPFKLESIWLDVAQDDNTNSSSTVTTELKIDVIFNGIIIGHYELKFGDSILDISPVIITSNLDLKLSPSKDINGILIYGKQVAIVENVVIP